MREFGTTAIAVVIAALGFAAHAAVSDDEARRLKGALTPTGA